MKKQLTHSLMPTLVTDLFIAMLSVMWSCLKYFRDVLLALKTNQKKSKRKTHFHPGDTAAGVA